jgi:hypothetical protein
MGVKLGQGELIGSRYEGGQSNVLAGSASEAIGQRRGNDAETQNKIGRRGDCEKR